MATITTTATTQNGPPSKPLPTITCADPPVSHLEAHAYLFGHPVKHSLSPLMHQTVYEHFKLNWSLLPLESTSLPQFLRLMKNPALFGSAVTMPHKIAILPHLDALTPECKAVGACNTIFKDADPATGAVRFVGTNTDIVGIRESFLRNLGDGAERVLGVGERPGMVVGGGGAARSAVYALVHYFRCPKVYMVNRDAEEVKAVVDWCREQGYGEGLVHVETVEMAEGLEAPGAVVSCVPNFPPRTEEEVRARGVLETFLKKERKGAMLEMCYHPVVWTEIAELAETNGWKVILGTEASIYQGLEQDRLWTGRSIDDMPVEKIKAVVATELGKPGH